MFRRWWTRLRSVAADDRGMVTAEYAVGTLAAAALATAFYKIATSDTVQAALRSLFERSLHAQF
ncbi:DUF4244 domain-containing protein [Streptomyces sp. NPDC059008]|uniref:DUF4244 domain-containing protein n=1 Tax=unclassified Streptomyces TaxID=2593676 RepID=UPI0036B5A28B